MSTFLKVLIVTSALLLSQAAVFNGVRFQNALKKGCAFGGALFLPFADFQPPQAQAIPAFDAATRAMTEKKEKTEEVDREFNSLPEGAKKRYALALCKDSTARRAGGYDSTQECTTQTISTNSKSLITQHNISLTNLPLSLLDRNALKPCSRAITRALSKGFHPLQVYDHHLPRRRPVAAPPL